MSEEKTELKAQVYEIGLLLVPTIPEESVPALFGTIKEVVAKAGGVIISEEFPKMRPLSYTMSRMMDAKRVKYDVAYFGWVKFDLTTGEIAKIKSELQANNDIIRFIIVKTVRENTIYGPKLAASKKAAEEQEMSKSREKTVEKPELSAEELDKTIDDLVISE